MPLFQASADISIFYAERGQGQPVVLLNGLSGDHLYFAAQMRAFSRQYRCLGVDNRDVGQSSYPQQPYLLRDLAGDVAGLLRHLQAPPAHIVGLSMGGMIALELALAEPALVKSLVLAGTLARSDAWFRATLQAFELIRRQVADTPAFFEAILPWWVSYRFLDNPERVAWLRWILRQNPHPQRLDGFLRQMQALLQHDVLDRLPTIQSPALVLVGEDDNVAPPRYARELAERLPKARLQILEGVGHAPPIENPGQFNACVSAFLAETGSAG